MGKGSQAQFLIQHHIPYVLLSTQEEKSFGDAELKKKKRKEKDKKCSWDKERLQTPQMMDTKSLVEWKNIKGHEKKTENYIPKLFYNVLALKTDLDRPLEEKE